MLDALLITRTQDEMTAALHESDGQLEIEVSADGLMALAMAQHRANFELWHEEDKARVPGVSDAEIAQVKRAIDVLNQRRNDLVEKMDVWLIDRLEQNDAAPLHSETPGLVGGGSPFLGLCLEGLWAEVLNGTRRFKLYRQMKMYNDPELNPAVYGRR